MQYSRCLMCFAIFFALAKNGESGKINTEGVKDSSNQTISKNSAAAPNTTNPFGLAITDFSFEFLRYLHDSESTSSGALKKNLVFSPSSIYKALLLLSFGAHGDTKSQLFKALHLEEFEGVEQDYKTWKGLHVTGVFEADRLYYDNSILIKEQIKALLTDDIHQVEMSGDSTLEEVNKWVSDMTQGKIEQLLTSPLQEVKLLLLSVLYMKGNWEKGFDEKHTQKDKFQTADGELKEVDMMNINTDLQYVDSETLMSEVVSLKYKDSPLSFLVFLPKDDQTVDDLLSSLSKDEVEKTVESMDSRRINLYLPKFRVQKDIDLLPMFYSAGIRDAITEKADFSDFTDTNKLYVKKALHEVVLEVEEKGTTAAAATAIETTFLSYSKARELKADHPFVYMIYDRDSRMPLFVGVMVDPTQ